MRTIIATMASSSSAAAAAPTPTTDRGLELQVLKNKVYEECLRLTEEDDKVVIHQSDVEAMDLMDEIKAVGQNQALKVLLDIVNKLLAEKLFKIVQDGMGMGWRVRTREEAKRFVPLFHDYCNWNTS